MADKYLWANNAVAQLGAGIDANATSIAVETGKGALFPSPGVGERFTVTLEDAAAEKIEVCYCTARSVDTLTVVRGQEGTTAQPFTAASTSVSNRITAAGLNGILAAFDDTDHGNRSGGALHAVATTGINGFMSAADKTKLDGIDTGAADDQTAAEILAALLTVDGSGSGLDADRLDGIEASGFAALAAIQTFTAIQTFGTTVNLDATTNVRNSTYGGSALAFLAGDTGDVILRPTSAANVFDTSKEFFYNKAAARWEFDETPFVVSDQIWHAGNDGAGSGLDADLLDGQEGAFYLALANATGILPSDTAHGDRGGGSLHADATISVAGFMSAADKTKLDDAVTIAGTQTITGAKTFSNTTVIQDDGLARFQFANATWGGRLARIFATNAGNFIFRPTSAGDVDFTDRDFRFRNDTDYWQFDSDLRVGNTLIVGGTATIGGNEVWHAGNDGAGSGLDADLLDGLQASSFVRGDSTNNGAVTIHVNDADFVVADTTDGIANYIWRNWSQGTLLLGTTDAQVEFRSHVYFNGSNLTPATGNVSGGAFSRSLNAIEISSANAPVLVTNRISSDGSTIDFRRAGTVVGYVEVTAGGAVLVSSSDAILKINDVPLEDAIDVLALLKDDDVMPKRYSRVEDGSIQDGFISQELMRKIPQAVVRGNDLSISDPDFKPWGRAIGQLEPYLWAICRKQQQKIEELESRVVTLER